MFCFFFFFSSKQIKLIFNHLLSFVRFRTKRKILVICSSYLTVNTLFNEKIQLYSILILSIYAFNLECIYLAMSAIQILQCVTFQFGFYLRYLINNSSVIKTIYYRKRVQIKFCLKFT